MALLYRHLCIHCDNYVKERVYAKLWKAYIKKDSIYCIKVMGLSKVGFFLLSSSIMVLYALIKYLVNKGLIVCLPLPIFATFVGIF